MMPRPAECLDAVLSLVEGGMTLVAACASRPDFPKYQTVYARLQRHPEMKARLAAAIAARSSFKTKTKYTGADYDEVLQIIADNPGLTIKRIFAQVMPDRLPRLLWIQRYRKRNKEFAARYDALVAARAGGVVKSWYNVETHGRASRRAEHRPSGQLLANLKRDDLWVRACNLLNLANDQDSDDIRQDAVLAMLESRELNRDALVLGHFRRGAPFRNLSLDEEVFDSGRGRTVARGDTIPASRDIGDVYAW